MDDPRDAALAVAWARRVQTAPWVRWALPERKPQGRRALLWLLHAACVLVALLVAIVLAWRDLGNLGTLRWVFVAFVAYGIVIAPWVLAGVLRTRWNAPEAELRNRELIDTGRR